jgi:GT2 family glycosyltransferase
MKGMPSTDSWPPVSVIICVYTERRWADILRAVQSVRAQDYGGLVEMMVVVDHNEALLARCQEEWDDVRVVASVGEKGLAGGRNTGTSVARGDVLVFLDDDAWAEARWLETLVRPYLDDNVIATGGWIVPIWPDARPKWFPPEFDWVVGCSYRGLPETTAEVRNVIGASMSFRASAFEKAGRFSESLGRVGTLPLGCEETEICIRARSIIRGAKVMHVPDAVVHHRVSGDRVCLRYFFHRCWSEGVSKAGVARLAGADAALATERTYTTRTLPAGVLQGIRSLLRRDPSGGARAVLIICGFLVTAAGYARERCRRPRDP